MIRLKESRSSIGYSQQKLAEKNGVSRSTIAMWETGGSQPDNEALVKLSSVLDVSIDYLLGQTPNPAVNPASTAVCINVYGSVPAGIPVEAIEDIDDWEEIQSSMTVGGQEYIGLRVSVIACTLNTWMAIRS